MDDKKNDPLKPFKDHGLEFVGRSGYSEQADCPFCGKARSFHVTPSTTLWICSSSPDVCGRSGNLVSFLGQWVDFCREETTMKQWKKLSKDRDDLPIEIFRDILKMGYNDLTDKWLIPIYTPKGTIQDVRRWSPGRRMMGTTGLKTGLWNCQELFDPRKKSWPVDLCEGEWDGGSKKYMNIKAHQRRIVVAVPGARVFKEEWIEWFKGRHVTWWYDNDADGIQYSFKRSFKLNKKAASQRFCAWPDTFETGFDVRDFLVGGIVERGITPKKTLYFLNTHVVSEHPLKDLSEERVDSTPEAKEMPRERPDHNPDFEATIKVYKKWLRMTNDLVDAVRFTYASILANQWPGNPVWGFLCGPPGSGKTEILMSCSKVYEVLLESSVGPKALVSGFKPPKEGEDPSLLPHMINKTTIFKDWTEIMDASELEQKTLYGILRGAYDGQVDRTFGNGEKRNYKGRFGILAGVTNKIHGQSRVTVGERFLKFQLRKMSAKRQDEVVRAAAMNALAGSAMREEIADAALAFLDRDMPADVTPVDLLPNWAIDRIVALSQIVAKLRHEVEWENIGGGERTLKYKPQAEVATRLSAQLTKFAMSLTIVDGKDRLDKESWKLVERLGFNTAIGFNMDIVEAIMSVGGGTLDFQELRDLTKIPGSSLRRKLEDLVVLGIMEPGMKHHVGVGRPANSWKIKKDINELWARVRPIGLHLKDAQYGREK